VPRLAFSAFDRYVEGDAMKWPQFQGWVSRTVPISPDLSLASGPVWADYRIYPNRWQRLCEAQSHRFQCVHFLPAQPPALRSVTGQRLGIVEKD
jgi:hypothetical protein